jgi:uncharacterized membrane protein YjjP (DUF1212 family)
VSRPQVPRSAATGWPRRLATHPLVPAALFTAGALVMAVQGHMLTWAVLGGLAGYTLSGSV